MQQKLGKLVKMSYAQHKIVLINKKLFTISYNPKSDFLGRAIYIISLPPINGNGGLTWYFPKLIRISAKLMPQARTATFT